MNSRKNRVSRQLQTLLKSFVQIDGLPFASMLSEEQLRPVLEVETGEVYTPIVTLWMFLSQVINPGSSCREAVARLLAWRIQTGQDACSSRDGAYCKARQKLDEQALKKLFTDSGNQLHRAVKETWLWKGRNVKLLDGTTFTAPDTPKNQQAYPQPDGQKPGLGFPMLRAVALISLASGAVLEMALAAYSGKGTGEVSLLRKLWESLLPGDLLVGDKIYCSYPEIAVLAARGVDFVLPKNFSRKTDFRSGRRLGRRDHVVTWTKPERRPDRLSVEEWAAVPRTLTLRETEVTLQRHGFRTKTIVVVTTLLDETEITADDLGQLYAMRWEVEVDLRSIKSAMGIGELSCRSPEMIRRELWVSLLAYNLLRGHMAEAASQAGLMPRDLSFSGAMQTMLSFLPQLSVSDTAKVPLIYETMLKAMSQHRVGNRPGRQDPRKIKRRRKHDLLNEPREEARKKIPKPVKI